MHAQICTPTNIINQPGIPMWTYAEDFMKILLKLADIWHFVYCPKLCAWFHILCMHARMCTPINLINLLGIPMWTYAEDFMTTLLKLADIWYFVYFPKLCAWFHILCMHACMCTPTNIINQHGIPMWTYAEDFIKILLKLADMAFCLLS